MTAVAVRICSHLASGAQRAYVEDGDARWCLECVADLPELASQPRYSHVVMLVHEAWIQKQAASWRAAADAEVAAKLAAIEHGEEQEVPSGPNGGVSATVPASPAPASPPAEKVRGSARTARSAREAQQRRKTQPKPFADRYAGRGTNAEDEAAIDQVWERYPDKTRAEIVRLLRRLRAEKSA